MQRADVHLLPKTNFDIFQKQLLSKRELEKLLILNSMKREGITLGPYHCTDKTSLQVEGAK